MLLTISEAATLTARTPRSVRYLIRTGKLNAIQKGKLWLVDASALPLTEAQRATLEARRSQLRETVEQVLLPPVATTPLTASGAVSGAVPR